MPYGSAVGPGGSVAWVLFTTSLPSLITYFYLQNKQMDEKIAFTEMGSRFGIPANETFDFIIVGAGTAGCVLARRLSEQYTVLLLEAGGDPPPAMDITSLVGYTKRIPGIHWFYGSVREKNAALSFGGHVNVTAGRMMGGSGSHNNVQYERGSPYDYDNWANFTGDPSWRYENVLKYFLKSENYSGKFTTSTGQHNTGGFVNVEASEVSFREDIFFSAGDELGFETRIDPNGPQRIGFCAAEFNKIKGRRSSSYTGYLQPIEGKRWNLTVRKYSLVTKVIIENFRAKGVYYTRHGIDRIGYAAKEVILSAGAYMSPTILMKSGIGSRDQIDKDLLVELPVGQNLQTHANVDFSVTVNDSSVYRLSPNKITFAELDEFITNGTGFLAARESAQEAFLASERAVDSDKEPNWPDIQLYFYQGYIRGHDVLNFTVSLGRPRSSGRLLLNRTATTPESSLIPILDYNLFSDESDYDVIISGIHMVQRIVGTKAFRDVGAKYHEDLVIPECKNFVPYTRDFWICYIRQRSSGNVHACSTARMGSPDDPTAVLDSQLRVRGVTGLRVVDASAMPFITNANINAAVMMLAEKASEDILHFWNQFT